MKETSSGVLHPLWRNFEWKVHSIEGEVSGHEWEIHPNDEGGVGAPLGACSPLEAASPLLLYICGVLGSSKN